MSTLTFLAGATAGGGAAPGAAGRGGWHPVAGQPARGHRGRAPGHGQGIGTSGGAGEMSIPHWLGRLVVKFHLWEFVIISVTQ